MPQNDRGKALKAMEATWNNMEKKEKLMWIKKAAEDQKRYEVGPCPFPPFPPSRRRCPCLPDPSFSSGSEGAERDAGPSVLHQLRQENEVPGGAKETPYVSTWGLGSEKMGLAGPAGHVGWCRSLEQPRSSGSAGWTVLGVAGG